MPRLEPLRSLDARELAGLLVQGASVQDDAAADVLGDPARRHLGREEDLLGCEPGAERSLHFPVAGGVHVEPEGPEYGEDPPARVRLHRVAKRETIRSTS